MREAGAAARTRTLSLQAPYLMLPFFFISHSIHLISKFHMLDTQEDV
jgi:hypothetical protein